MRLVLTFSPLELQSIGFAEHRSASPTRIQRPSPEHGFKKGRAAAAARPRGEPDYQSSCWCCSSSAMRWLIRSSCWLIASA
jgi:hypothetical protein